MDNSLTVDQKYDLITRNLQEKLDDEIIVKKILSQRNLIIYWGTAPTGKIHLGYFVPMLKIADFLKAGCEVIILLADLHAFLDNMKSSLKLIELRTEYYQIIIKEILKSLAVDITKLKFVKGSSFQLSKEYTMDVYKANSMITIKEAQHAGAEVVKQTSNPIMNGLLYPTLQALDEEYLKVDAELGGIDQRKILVFSKEILSKLGYKKRFHYMNQMVPGLRFSKNDAVNDSEVTQVLDNLRQELENLLNSEKSDNLLLKKLRDLVNKLDTQNSSDAFKDKMSSSKQDSKIDLLDTKNQIKTKINKAYCFPGDIDDNCLMTMLEKIILPILQTKGLDFTINRIDKFGGKIIYKNIEEIKKDFKEQKLHPADFKFGIIDNLDIIIEQIRTVFQSKELTDLVNKAYPNK